MPPTQEATRLGEVRAGKVPWRKWGPYLSERQWGTVREDYSEDGNAWDYFGHDQARSRAYHWGEDGLAGISDDRQLLCFSVALWNGKDAILKERLFGLTNSESNHGEDVKEYYFYLDSTPTHSYMKYLYKYPQGAFPYDDLVETNGQRSRNEPEYELIDTGAYLRRIATLTFSSSIARRNTRRHLDSSHSSINRGDFVSDATPASPPLVSQYLAGSPEREQDLITPVAKRRFWARMLRRSVPSDAREVFTGTLIGKAGYCSPTTRQTRNGFGAVRIPIRL